MGALATGAELGEAEFRAIAALVHDIAGIRLGAGKEGLVRARLQKRLRALGLDDFGTYVAHVQALAHRGELAEMVDLLTTNKTDFFREPAHFAFLEQHVFPALVQRGGPLRFWSAGCSTGAEPMTLAMVACEALPEAAAREVRILATDLSARVLKQAASATYDDEQVAGVSEALRRKYFDPAPGARGPAWKAKPVLTQKIRYARLNLMGPWPMKGPFDAILCRNVMIYFDKATQERLVQRFQALLPEGGHLLIGHSESLSGAAHALTYVKPAVYRA
ncbi:MAG: protein-glutamate O-methyltransferase CheR [Gemmatimonadetes bacterium]|nr:protein-glutamate O-methyltransferase CheR [Gemmatimonadota bacterium]